VRIVGRKYVALEPAHVRPLENRDARVVTELRVELAVADVERGHARGARLEEAVDEAPGRGADVETVLAGDVDPEDLERVRELLAAAGDEARALGELELGSLVDLLAGLRMPSHAPGQDERLRLRAALGEPTLDEQHIQALLRAHGQSVPRAPHGELSRMRAIIRAAAWSRSSSRAPWRGRAAARARPRSAP